MTITREQMQVLNEAAQAGVLRRQRTINDRRIRFSMTGRMSLKRSDVVTLIRAVEGVWDEAPTYGTDYLIVGDTSVHGTTAKMATARQLGVKIITEDEFVAMLMPS